MTSLWENAIIAAYRHNIVCALPFTVLIAKLIVRFVAREPKKDLFRSILLLPLDFIYIAMGILLAAAARRDPILISHYDSETSADMAVALQMGLLIFSAIVVTYFERWSRMLYQKFYSAWELFNAKFKAVSDSQARNVDSDGQMNLSLPAANGPTFSRESGILLVWIVFYWTLMIPLQLAQFVIGVFCLGSILGRLR